jgi:glutathione S-transferase
MAILYHHPFCPFSRFVRLVLAEMNLEADLIEEKVWERREGFLALNPAGTTPVLADEQIASVPGSIIIAEWLDETRGEGLGDRRLMPQSAQKRVEVRRLMNWFTEKFGEEVSVPLVQEKIYKRFIPSASGGGSPDPALIRAAKNNVKYHLQYIGYLIRQRKWLAGDAMTYADLMAASHISVVDYLGDVPWDEDATAREWYARVKSRPSFRALIADRVIGMPPSASYADLDF